MAKVLRITLRQSILSVMQMPEFGRQITYGAVIDLHLLIYGREKPQSCMVPSTGARGRT